MGRADHVRGHTGRVYQARPLRRRARGLLHAFARLPGWLLLTVTALVYVGLFVAAVLMGAFL